MKYVIRVASSAWRAGTALKSLNNARHDKDNLKMLEAGVSIMATAVAAAILLREIREDRESEARAKLEEGR